jgi:hypothetical protein
MAGKMRVRMSLSATPQDSIGGDYSYQKKLGIRQSNLTYVKKTH